MQGTLFRCFFFFLVLAATEFVLGESSSCREEPDLCPEDYFCYTTQEYPDGFCRSYPNPKQDSFLDG
uniref:Uncharacterized protein n=1 Tax=Strigamia maritima TaxID=126957 RepID=T1IZ54_STRMM